MALMADFRGDVNFDLVLAGDAQRGLLTVRTADGSVFVASNALQGVDDMLQKLGNAKLGRLRIFDYISGDNTPLPAVQFTRLEGHFGAGGQLEIYTGLRQGTKVNMDTGGVTNADLEGFIVGHVFSNPSGAQSLHLSALLKVPVTVREL